MKKTLLIFLIAFNYVFISAQQRIEKLDQLLDKFTSVIYKNTDSAYYFCKQADDLNKKIGNDYYGARCLFSYALYYYNIGNNLKAGEYDNKALVLAKKTNNTDAFYRIYNLKGVIFFEAGEYDKAFNEFQKTQYYLKKKPDYKYFGISYLNLGNLFMAKGDTVSGIKNYHRTAKYSILAKDTARLLSSYFLIANAVKNKDFQKAHNYYEKAFHLAKLTNDKQEQFNIRFNQSGNYLDSKNIDRNEKALFYLRKAEKILKQLGDKSLYFYINFNYGAYYMNKNEGDNAIRYYELAYKEYDPERIPINQKLDILKNLINIYKKDHNYQKSYEYQSQFYKLKDSLFTIEKEKNYNQLLAKYEVEKKNSQIQLLSKENELQKVRKTRMYFVLGLIIFLLLLGFFFYKNKLKSEQKLIIKQQELNRTKDVLEGQSKERNRLAKELHDGVSGSLVGINFMLAKENDLTQNHNISTIQNHINTLYNEIREISHNLSNNFLAEKTFYQLLQHLTKQDEEKGNFVTHILFFPENALDHINEELKTNLYRIIQELFTNIRKHARASRVQINVTQNKDTVCLMIEDNGKGFGKNRTEGIGLKNIRERLGILNATIEIDSFPNNGTTVTITFRI